MNITFKGILAFTLSLLAAILLTIMMQWVDGLIYIKGFLTGSATMVVYYCTMLSWKDSQ